MSNVLLALVGGALFFLGGNALAQEDPAHEQARFQEVQALALSHVTPRAIARSERRAFIVVQDTNGRLTGYPVFKSEVTHLLRHFWAEREGQLIGLCWEGSDAYAYISALPPPTDPASAEIGTPQIEGVQVSLQ